MATVTESQRQVAFVLGELCSIAVDQVTIVSGAGILTSGMVLGKITASGKYDGYDNTAATGIETAAAVLLYDVDATAADVAATVVARLTQVKSSLLVWDVANDANAKAAGIADLATKFIIAR